MTFSSISSSFLFIYVLAVSISTITFVSGMKLQLFHKTHPKVKSFFASSLSDVSEGSFKGNITTKSSEYVVHFSVGTPPFKTFAVFDTGSPVLWLQSSTCKRCMPVKNGTQVDLDKSPTSERVLYGSDDCNYWTSVTTTFSGNNSPPSCCYTASYMDGTKSTGYVITDLITFMDAFTPGKELKARLMIGVGISNYGIFKSPSEEIMANPGVFGMSHLAWYQFYSKLHITKFSYCIPRNNSEIGYVLFGEAAKFFGPTIQYSRKSLYYTLNLTDVSMNGEPLEPWGRGTWNGLQMTFDTGTPVSRIHPVIYESIITETIELFGDFVRSWDRKCWNKVDSKVIHRLRFTLHFDQLSFNLYEYHIFKKIKVKQDGKDIVIYCLNIIEAPGNSIIGTMQSTDKNVAIDWLAGEIAIEEMTC